VELRRTNLDILYAQQFAKAPQNVFRVDFAPQSAVGPVDHKVRVMRMLTDLCDLENSRLVLKPQPNLRWSKPCACLRAAVKSMSDLLEKLLPLLLLGRSEETHEQRNHNKKEEKDKKGGRVVHGSPRLERPLGGTRLSVPVRTGQRCDAGLDGFAPAAAGGGAAPPV